MKTVYAPKDGTFFWVLYWATHAVDEDPLAIIQYYSALRELYPLCSEYDRRLLQDALQQWCANLDETYPDNTVVQYHTALIRGWIDKEGV